MTRAALIQDVAAASAERYTPKDLEDILQYLENAVIRTLANGESVKLFKGLILEPKQSDGRRYINPQNGKWEVSEPSIRCTARTTKTFRDRISAMAK